MTAPIRPASVKTFGKQNWIYVPTIADIAAPTAAEVNSASGLDLSGYLFVDGFDGVTGDTTRVTDPRRIADTVTYEGIGTSSYSMSDLQYAFDPQAAALSNGKKAFEKLPEGTSGYLIRRLGIDRNTTPAAGQFVSVFPVSFGVQLEVEVGDAESAVVAIRQPVAITGAPSINVAIAA